MDIKKLFTNVTDTDIKDIQNNSISFLLISKNKSEPELSNLESEFNNIKLTAFHNCTGKNNLFSYLVRLETMILKFRELQKKVANDNGMNDATVDIAIKLINKFLKKENE